MNEPDSRHARRAAFLGLLAAVTLILLPAGPAYIIPTVLAGGALGMAARSLLLP